jgi:hypothetical protein
MVCFLGTPISVLANGKRQSGDWRSQEVNDAEKNVGVAFTRRRFY